jgi:hypothetical protein
MLSWTPESWRMNLGKVGDVNPSMNSPISYASFGLVTVRRCLRNLMPELLEADQPNQWSGRYVDGYGSKGSYARDRVLSSVV